MHEAFGEDFVRAPESMDKIGKRLDGNLKNNILLALLFTTNLGLAPNGN